MARYVPKATILSTARAVARATILAALVASSLGCGRNPVVVNLFYPTEEERADTVSVHIWVLDADADDVDCPVLMAGTSFPYDPLLASYIEADVVFFLANPEEPEVTDVSSGRRIFYVEGVSFSGETHLSGCEEVRLRRSTRDVLVTLLVRPDGSDCTGAPDGAPCDDGLICTLGDVCTGGSCDGSPLDCSALDNDCGTGVCDEAALGCVLMPSPDGTPCDAGFCEENATCFTGFCSGTPRDCSAVATGPCEIGSCDAVAETCVATPLFDGAPCDDGLYCTFGELCFGGTCASGIPTDCSFLSGPCATGACDEVMDTCFAMPVVDGTLCDDGLYCTSGELCTAGACSGGTPTDCSAASDDCNVGTCDEILDTCFPMPVVDGTLCDDMMMCSSMDACTAGVCSGIAGTEGPVGDPTCSDGVDNNCDMLIDAADPNC